MKPMPHQREMADIICREPQWGFWYETGTGKTIGTLLGLEESRPFPCLVLAPKNVVTHAWMKDAAHFPSIRVVAAVGSPKSKRIEAYQMIRDGHADVLLTNYESAVATKEEIENTRWGCIILDESTRLKSHSAVTTRMLLRLAAMQPHTRRYCLSGYPAPNSRLDLWGQSKFLRDEVLGRSFTRFRANYFYQPNANHTWLWLPKFQSEEAIDERMAMVSSWKRKEECLNLPEKVDEYHEVELHRDEMRAYKQFVADWIIRFDTGEITASNALVELMKCRQMCAGLVRRNDGGWEDIGNTKLRLARSIADSDPTPIMIIGEFRRELERLNDEIEDSALLYGGMPKKKTDAIIEGFQSGGFKVLIAHPGCMSHGLTFTVASRMVFASLSYSFERYIQTKDRIHRYGQKRTCVYHHLLAKGTVDYDIMRAMKGKSDITVDMLRNFKELARG